MSQFIETMKNRIDLMTSDQIIYLFIPELLAMKDIAEEKQDDEKVYEINIIVAYVKTKVELDEFKVHEDFGNTSLIVPPPSHIIKGKSPKWVPNN